MTAFWRSSGYHLLEPGADGWLRPSDDFLRAYLLRPELVPVDTGHVSYFLQRRWVELVDRLLLDRGVGETA